MNIVTLNALIEALQSGKPLNRVLLNRARGDKKIEMIKRLCRENRVAYQMVPPEAIKRKAGAQNQGVFAELSPVRFYELEEIL
jgi:23S rRNA (guanosine2251-2'-O)-methyltransferase